MAEGAARTEEGGTSASYEADDHAGLRIKSDRDTWADGHATEWGGEFIDTGHATIQGLAARANLALDNLHAAEPRDSTETYFYFACQGRACRYSPLIFRP